MNASIKMEGLDDLAALGLDVSNSVSFIDTNAGILYTCYPSMKVAIRSDIAKSGFYDQSTMKDVVDPSLKFKGTKAATLDGIQCTVYMFEQKGITANIYVRNSVEVVVRITAQGSQGKVDVYFKNMEIGMVTNGDVLMTNTVNGYKKLNGMDAFADYVMEYFMKKMGQ